MVLLQRKANLFKKQNNEHNYRIPIIEYELICTHTARRTSATLMYLDGIAIYDIMKVTGHKSVTTLEKYIRADKLEVAQKLVLKYDYFK